MNRSGCARSRSRSTRISPRGNKEGHGVGQGDRQRREEGGRDHRDKCRMSASDPAVTRDHRWDPCLPRALAKQVARLVRVRFPPPPPSHGIGRDVIKGEVAPRPTCCEASGGVINLLEVLR